MRLVDLSHVIEHGMITYPGLPGPEIGEHLDFDASAAVYAAGTEFTIGRIAMVSNTGTYLDTPPTVTVGARRRAPHGARPPARAGRAVHRGAADDRRDGDVPGARLRDRPLNPAGRTPRSSAHWCCGRGKSFGPLAGGGEDRPRASPEIGCDARPPVATVPIAGVAQSEEQRSPKPPVAGSSPVARAPHRPVEGG